MREAESRKTKTKREDRTCEIKCKHSRAKLSIPVSSRPSKANRKLLHLLFQFLVCLYFLFALRNSFFFGQRLFSRYGQDGTTATELNNALRMFVTSLFSSTLVPELRSFRPAPRITALGLWKICVRNGQ